MNKDLKKSWIKIPKWILEIIYNPKIFPNWEVHDYVKDGANCQVFAYEILKFNWKKVPDLRSSEMWADNKISFEVHDFEKLDLIFFNNSTESYWAHVWLYIWNNKVIHNTNKTWWVEIWDLEEFRKYEDYQFILWWKRFF
jgi:hypothetical protein